VNNTLILIGFIVVGITAFLYFAAQRMKRIPAVSDSEKIKKLNDSNFKKQISSGINIVDFWAEWCVPCKAMAPVLNKVADETKGTATVCKVNVDHAKQTAAKFHIKSIPTIIIFKYGKEAKRIVGVKTKAHILEQLELTRNK
jgi:thioredoxin 1